MRAGRAFAAARGVAVERDERIEPFGEGWLIRRRRGFTPCPWAFEMARFAPARPGDRCLDLGCGNGVLLAAMRQRHPDLGVCLGVERQAAILPQAARNAALMGAVAFSVVQGDVRQAPVPPRAFDLVLSNPPFYPAGWGRLSADAAEAGSTHALEGDVDDFARAAARAMNPRGRAIFVYDADHLTALLLAMSNAGLMVRGLRFLDDDRGRPARVLALAGFDGGGLTVERQAFS